MSDMSDVPITLTPAARDKAAEFLRGDKNREVFRVSVDDRGKLSVELDKVRGGDKTFMQGEVNVAVAEPLVGLLRGLVIDFGPNPQGQTGFSFSGPPQNDSDLGRKAKDALAHAGGGAVAHHGGEHSTETQYMKIFFALIILTAVELGCVFMPMPKWMLILILVALAFVKATLVGMYFMHLKFEGRWKYILIVPASMLAVVLIFALFPDVGRTGAWPADTPAASIAPSDFQK